MDDHDIISFTTMSGSRYMIRNGHLYRANEKPVVMADTNLPSTHSYMGQRITRVIKPPKVGESAVFELADIALTPLVTSVVVSIDK